MTWAKQQGKTSKRPSHRDRLKQEAERVAEDHRRLKAGFLRREKATQGEAAMSADEPPRTWTLIGGSTSERMMHTGPALKAMDAIEVIELDPVLDLLQSCHSLLRPQAIKLAPHAWPEFERRIAGEERELVEAIAALLHAQGRLPR